MQRVRIDGGMGNRQVTAHGGAVESLLDETTAELAKLEWAPVLATIELANFRIKKARSIAAPCSVLPANMQSLE